MPAAKKKESDLVTRVLLALQHVDPDVRTLAEAVLALQQRVSWLEAKTGTLAMDDDGK